MTVVVTALVKIQPDVREDALAALTRGIEGTHGEDGNITYALHEDLNAAGHFVIIEKWTSQEALQAHGETPHLQAMFAELGPLLAEPPTIVFTSPLPVGDEAKSSI
jgi:quinol monooxygenase YgiN